MNGKSEASHCEAFTKLVLFNNCRFENIIIDFEGGLKNGIQRTLTKANLLVVLFILARLFGLEYRK